MSTTTPPFSSVLPVACRARSAGASAELAELDRALLVRRNQAGVLESQDSYSKGVIQGLQRAIVSYSAKQGRAISIFADGTLNRSTVDSVIAIVSEIGLPPGIAFAPKTDEQIALDARRYTEHIAAAAGVDSDIQPSDPVFLSNSASPGKQTSNRRGLLSSRNLLFGAALGVGFLVLKG